LVVTDEEIQDRILLLGKDSDWGFQPVEFDGNQLKKPSREDLAIELAAFANARGGHLLCGIASYLLKFIKIVRHEEFLKFPW